MLSQGNNPKEDRSRMEFFAYFAIVMMMVLVAFVTFVFTRTFTCG